MRFRGARVWWYWGRAVLVLKSKTLLIASLWWTARLLFPLRPVNSVKRVGISAPGWGAVMPRRIDLFCRCPDMFQDKIRQPIGIYYADGICWTGSRTIGQTSTESNASCGGWSWDGEASNVSWVVHLKAYRKQIGLHWSKGHARVSVLPQSLLQSVKVSTTWLQVALCYHRCPLPLFASSLHVIWPTPHVCRPKVSRKVPGKGRCCSHKSTGRHGAISQSAEANLRRRRG